NNSPPFKRHSVGRTYPWQVAPQQSLLPFRFNNTKFKSVNYIYNLSKFPATFKSSSHSSQNPTNPNPYPLQKSIHISQRHPVRPRISQHPGVMTGAAGGG